MLFLTRVISDRPFLRTFVFNVCVLYFCVKTDFVDLEDLRFCDFCAEWVEEGLTFVFDPGVAPCGWLGLGHHIMMVSVQMRFPLFSFTNGLLVEYHIMTMSVQMQFPLSGFTNGPG